MFKPIYVLWKKFNYLTCIEEWYRVKEDKFLYVDCVCDCGRKITIRKWIFMHWRKQSCWECEYTKYKKHWMTHNPFYRIYNSMVQRCSDSNNKEYKWYWWRWIKMLRTSFEEFKNDMYESYLEHKKNNSYTSIDRIDNNWNYCKENCRRATNIEQWNNKRTTNILTYNWITKTMIDRWKQYWLTSRIIARRIKYYWRTIERALNEKLNINFTPKTNKKCQRPL